jgi:LacI family transcriptional regulator
LLAIVTELGKIMAQIDMKSDSCITLRDIAENLGVSLTTVSLALRENHKIPAERRKQIQEAARRMGYIPNPMAAALAHQRYSSRTHSIGAEIAWVNYWQNPEELCGYKEFDLYWKGAFRVAEDRGYRLEEFRCDHRMSSYRLEQILLTRNIQGILLPPHGLIDLPVGWDKIHWDKFSIVRMGYSIKYPRSHVVTGDQLNSGLIGFENIRRRGYRRIGYVCGERTTMRAQAGFLMMQLEMAPEDRVPILILPDRDDHSVDPAPLCAWLKKYRPDAILTEISAMPGILEQAGYRIPQDIGLATTSVLDGNADSGINQNSEEIGKVAMELLISLINHQQKGVPKFCREVLVESMWVDGSTLPWRIAPQIPPTPSPKAEPHKVSSDAATRSNF